MVRGITALLAPTSAARNKSVLPHYLPRFQAKQFNKLYHPPTRRGVNTPLFYGASNCSQVEPDKYTSLRPPFLQLVSGGDVAQTEMSAAGFVPNPCIPL